MRLDPVIAPNLNPQCEMANNQKSWVPVSQATGLLPRRFAGHCICAICELIWHAAERSSGLGLRSDLGSRIEGAEVQDAVLFLTATLALGAVVPIGSDFRGEVNLYVMATTLTSNHGQSPLLGGRVGDSMLAVQQIKGRL